MCCISFHIGRLCTDFPKLSGVEAIIELLLNSNEAELHAEALYLLGTAASNNRDFQLQALQEPNLVPAICVVFPPPPAIRPKNDE